MYIQRFAEDSHIIGVIGVRFSKDHIFKGQIPNLRILHIRDERALTVRGQINTPDRVTVSLYLSLKFFTGRRGAPCEYPRGCLPVLEACHINIFCQPIISLIIIKGRQPVVNPLPQSSTSA